MKYSRQQFKEEHYQLWETGMNLPVAQSSNSYVVKYRIGEASEYSLVEIKAQSIGEALEQACFRAATESSASPEEVDLHSVYDTHGKLLWGDELPYALTNSKNSDNGMNRREFLTAFGLVNAALLFGLPKVATAATTSVSLAGTASGFTYVDDVFSTYLYTGNGGTQTIVNGIDLTGNGGMVWCKSRVSPGDGQFPNHVLTDTIRGAGKALITDTTDLENPAGYASALYQFNSSGFSLNAPTSWPGSWSNRSGVLYVSWTFRKAPRFFDVVSFTATAGSQTISHSLGVAPGMVIIKNTTGTEDWLVYHHSTGKDSYGRISKTNAFTTFTDAWGTTGATNTSFSISASLKTTGQTYIAYFFAHDANADGIIHCGSVTYPGSGQTVVNLGWEPQYILFKDPGVSDWHIMDTSRGITSDDTGSSKTLAANSMASESNGNWGHLTSTGFTVYGWSAGTGIYMAIRRPNKPPTVGTQVYNAIARTGTGSDTNVASGFVSDTVIISNRAGGGSQIGGVWDRLRGLPALKTNSTNAESTGMGQVWWDTSNGIIVKGDAETNSSGGNFINHFFRRAPGFMDVVCYTGNGDTTANNTKFKHNLGVSPELVVLKLRDSDPMYGWTVQSSLLPNTGSLGLHQNGAVGFSRNPYLSSTEFNLFQGIGGGNESGKRYVAYLFATCPGISKVGTYTGDGAQGKVINCGFTTGARFVLIKRTDSSGDWYVWDSTRGIIAGNDPHLSLNTTAAEVTGDDSIDLDNSGFVVNQIAATNINTLNANYIFLAIA